MRSIAVLLLVVMSFVGNGVAFAQTQILTHKQEEAVRGLLNKILYFVDKESRYGCGDRLSPQYFPQYPKLAITYRGGGFSPEFWRQIKEKVRMNAPSATLVPYNAITPDTYRIDVVSVASERGSALTTVTYRSSFDFRDMSKSKAAKMQTNSAKLVDNYTVLILAKGHFVDIVDETAKIKAGDKRFRAIANSVKEFELASPETDRLKPVDYDTIAEKWLTAYEHGPKVMIAVLRRAFPGGNELSGKYRVYLVELVGNQWRVVDSETIVFSDYLSPGPVCKEP